MINWIVEAIANLSEVTGTWGYAFLVSWVLWGLCIASASYLLKRPNLVDRLEAANVSSLMFGVPCICGILGSYISGFICLMLILAH